MAKYALVYTKTWHSGWSGAEKTYSSELQMIEIIASNKADATVQAKKELKNLSRRLRKDIGVYASDKKLVKFLIESLE